MMIPLSRSVLQDRKSPLPATQIALSDAKPPRVTASQAGLERIELPAPNPGPRVPRARRCHLPAVGGAAARGWGRGEGSRGSGCSSVLGRTEPGRGKAQGRAGCNFKLSGTLRLPGLPSPPSIFSGPQECEKCSQWPHACPLREIIRGSRIGEERSSRQSWGARRLKCELFSPSPRLPPQSGRPFRPGPPSSSPAAPEPSPSSTPRALERPPGRSGEGGGLWGPGFAAQEGVLMTLEGKKAAPSSPTPRPWGWGRSSRGPGDPSWVPEMLSPGQGTPSWVPSFRSEVGRPPSFCAPHPQAGERAPPRSHGEALGREQRTRPSESARRGGPAPGGPGQKPGCGASPEVPGSARGRGGPSAARPGPGGARSLLGRSGVGRGAPPSRKCRGGGQRRADFFGRVRAGRCLVGRERGSGPTPAPTVCLRRGFERLAPSWVGTGPSEAGGPPGARSRRGFPRGRRGREGHPSALPPGSRVAALRAPPPTPPWPAGARGPRLAAPGPGGSRSGKVH